MKCTRIRYQQTGEFHFLTFSCYRRRSYMSPARQRISTMTVGIW
jgi:hypothetical protein